MKKHILLLALALTVGRGDTPDKWRHIVCGEAGGGWPEGTRLVAWTMRAWEVNLGYAADKFGPRLGWYGWCENPDEYAWAAVKEAYGGDLTAAPFDWMQEGKWCRHLGSATDAAWWLKTGFVAGPADVVVVHPRLERYQLHCWFQK